MLKIMELTNMEFITLLNTPKHFVNECKGYLQQLGNDQQYDYAKFINEELTELITNHEETKHVNNRALLVDDIVDSLWTILAQSEKIAINLFDVKNEDNDTLIKMIKHLLNIYNHYNKENNMQALQNTLADLFYMVQSLAVNNSIDYIAAFKELCNENMSKLAFNDHWLYSGNDNNNDFRVGNNPISLHDIFRDNKLQKKDKDGKFYEWYKPADFTKF